MFDREYRHTHSGSGLNALPGSLLGALGLDRETAPVLWLILGSLLLIAAVLLVTDGSIVAAFFPMAALALAALTFYRVDYSFFVLVGCVLIFDQFHIPGFYPYTYIADYFRNLKEISFLPSFSAGVVNPVELHFLFLLFIWFLLVSIRKRFRFRGLPVWGSFTLFIGWIVLSFAYGLKSGGTFLTGLWEVRALFYFTLFYLAVPQIVQNRRQLRILLWIVILAISFKALQGVARFAGLGFSFAGHPTLTNHEDPVFMNTLFILLLGLWIFRSAHSHKYGLVLLMPLLTLGFFMGQRRAAMASLFVSLVAFFLLLQGRQKWKFSKWALPVLVGLVIYGAAFWNSDSLLARPVEMVRSGIYTSRENLSEEDYYSNLYRRYENYNLAYTMRQNPVMGTGFGRKYEMPLELANIDFTLREYIPHNQIFWVIVKTGAVGFFLFWLFFNAFVFRGVRLMGQLRDPWLKAICVMVIVAVINQLVVSYYDLQLTYYRNMIYLGCLMGLLPVLRELDLEEETRHLTSPNANRNVKFSQS